MFSSSLDICERGVCVGDLSRVLWVVRRDRGQKSQAY